MEIIWLILLILVSAGAGYIVYDFALMFFKGVHTRGEITGFTQGKFMRLPILKFTDEQGQEQEYQARQIDQLIYMLNPAYEGDLIDIVYRPEDPSNMRVFGGLRLIAAVLALLPILMLLFNAIGKSALGGQFAYILTFALLILGGLTLIKLIQRYY